MEAEQWFPGKFVPGVRTMTYGPSPGKSANVPHGIAGEGDSLRVVHEGDWVTWEQDGTTRVYSPEGFKLRYEPADGRAGGA